jgi:hypothetical protein
MTAGDTSGSSVSWRNEWIDVIRNLGEQGGGCGSRMSRCREADVGGGGAKRKL